MMRPGLLFCTVLGLALALRLGLALAHEGYWGVDTGASLLTVNAVLSNEPTGAGFPKPPLAPGWLLAPFVLLMGQDIGYKVWSAVFAILPLFPVFLLTRKYVGAWPAVFAVSFAAIDLTWGEMFVTGAHPLGAFALLGMAWWSMGNLAKPQTDYKTLRDALVLAVSVGLIPWVNQTAAALALILLPVYWLTIFALAPSDDDRGDFFWRTIASIFTGGVLGVCALPWYLQTLPGSPILTYGGPTLYWAWDWSTAQSFLIALPLGLFVFWKAPDHRIKGLGLMLIILGIMVNFLSFDEVLINPLYRARYLMALLVYPLITWTVWRYWLPRVHPKAAWGFGAAVFLYFGVGFVYIVQLQNEYSTTVTRETSQALEWLQVNDPEPGVATNSFSLSLFVAAINRVHSPFAFAAPPPPAYVDDYRDLRCILNWRENCDPMASAYRLEIEYLLIEERFPYYNLRAPGNYLAPPEQWKRTAEAPWLNLVYAGGTTRLWHVAPESPGRHISFDR